ncbi:MAG: DUF1330 domain-containing protein [Alphaproteobacteria bacterium]|nr:DUF1330 domain-containing protein [Alphaproteobacteria bacterium]
MEVVNAVYPQPAQIAALLAQESEAPVVMVNLLKFKAAAAYADGRPTTLSGRDAYMLYGEQMTALVAAQGGRMMHSVRVEALVIGEVGELWDAVALVEYPSAKAFVAIATSPEVNAIGVHRAAGLAGQLLIQCRTL